MIRVNSLLHVPAFAEHYSAGSGLDVRVLLVLFACFVTSPFVPRSVSIVCLSPPEAHRMPARRSPKVNQESRLIDVLAEQREMCPLQNVHILIHTNASNVAKHL